MIPHVAAVHVLNSPARPSRSGNRIFSSVSVLSANFDESGQEFDEITTTCQFEPAQNGVSDPAAALERHLELNVLPADSPIFAYCAGVRVKPMTYDCFHANLYELCTAVNVAHRYPHSLRMGNTLELILTNGM
jgi:hypothetical protein